jgi:hypothetical protein
MYLRPPRVGPASVCVCGNMSIPHIKHAHIRIHIHIHIHIHTLTYPIVELECTFQYSRPIRALVDRLGGAHRCVCARVPTHLVARAKTHTLTRLRAQSPSGVGSGSDELVFFIYIKCGVVFDSMVWFMPVSLCTLVRVYVFYACENICMCLSARARACVSVCV